jgi:hypothetical protein
LGGGLKQGFLTLRFDIHFQTRVANLTYGAMQLTLVVF